MILLILISALAAWGIVAAAVEACRRGPRAVPTDWSRVPDGARRRPVRR